VAPTPGAAASAGSPRLGRARRRPGQTWRPRSPPLIPRRRRKPRSSLQDQNRSKTAIRDARAGTVGRGPNHDKTAICRTLIGPQSPSAGPSEDEKEICRPCLQPTTAAYCSFRCLNFCSVVLIVYFISVLLLKLAKTINLLLRQLLLARRLCRSVAVSGRRRDVSVRGEGGGSGRTPPM